MRFATIAAAIGLSILGSAGTATAQTQHCNQGNAAAGTVVGAFIGGTTGGIIASNNRGFRGNSFRRGNFRRGGFRRGNQGLGIVLGALAGGVVGNQIATRNTRNCVRNLRTQQSSFGHHNSTDGNIDYNARRLGDPYGGQRVVNQTQTHTSNGHYNTTTGQQYQSAQQAPSQSQGFFQPVCQNVNQTTRLPDGRVLNQPVEFCQFSPGGEWIQR